MFFLGLNEAGGFVQIRIMTFNRNRRNFDCAFKDFWWSFPFDVFTRRDGCATVIVLWVFRDQEGSFFFFWRSCEKVLV